jgi:hypothetical protein
MSSEMIYLPVSLGEAIDKLTILDIKLLKIKDNRRNDVKIEYDMLYDKLKMFINVYPDLYNQMKHVNLLIWDMMDKLRDGCLDDNSYFIECKKCVEYNDIRFRIKNKINDRSRSTLKEQKGYLLNKIEINIQDGVSDKLLIKPIKYLSLVKDIVIICTNNMAIKEKFIDDSNIVFTNNIGGILIDKNMDIDKILHFLKIDISEMNILV